MIEISTKIAASEIAYLHSYCHVVGGHERTMTNDLLGQSKTGTPRRPAHLDRLQDDRQRSQTWQSSQHPLNVLGSPRRTVRRPCALGPPSSSCPREWCSSP